MSARSYSTGGVLQLGDGDTVAQTEEECDKASSHREGDLTADDASTQQDNNTPADPSVGTDIDNKPKLTNLEKRGRWEKETLFPKEILS